MTELEDLKSKLLEKIRASRVSDEVQGLSGHFFAGTVWQMLGRAAVGAISILFLFWIVAELSPGCTKSCLIDYPGICCWSTPQSLFSFFGLIFIAFSGSFVTTKLSREDHFKNSALVSTFVLMVFLAVSLSASVSLTFTAIFCFAIFLALFYGYRCGLH